LRISGRAEPRRAGDRLSTRSDDELWAETTRRPGERSEILDRLLSYKRAAVLQALGLRSTALANTVLAD
jgi:hypothetical protein